MFFIPLEATANEGDKCDILECKAKLRLNRSGPEIIWLECSTNPATHPCRRATKEEEKQFLQRLATRSR